MGTPGHSIHGRTIYVTSRLMAALDAIDELYEVLDHYKRLENLARRVVDASTGVWDPDGTQIILQLNRAKWDAFVDFLYEQENNNQCPSGPSLTAPEFVLKIGLDSASNSEVTPELS